MRKNQFYLTINIGFMNSGSVSDSFPIVTLLGKVYFRDGPETRSYSYYIYTTFDFFLRVILPFTVGTFTKKSRYIAPSFQAVIRPK